MKRFRFYVRASIYIETASFMSKLRLLKNAFAHHKYHTFSFIVSLHMLKLATIRLDRERQLILMNAIDEQLMPDYPRSFYFGGSDCSNAFFRAATSIRAGIYKKASGHILNDPSNEAVRLFTRAVIHPGFSLAPEWMAGRISAREMAKRCYPKLAVSAFCEEPWFVNLKSYWFDNYRKLVRGGSGF